MLPWQILPSPVNPGLQEHWYEPTTLTQSPSEEQSCLLDVHSSVSTHELQETEKLDVWAHNINTTAIRGTLHLALDTFVNMYSRLKEDEKNHNIPYFEIDLFHLKCISIVLINYFCQFFPISTIGFQHETYTFICFISVLVLASNIYNWQHEAVFPSYHPFLFGYSLTFSFFFKIYYLWFITSRQQYFDITSRLMLQKNIL